jgi:hypothetical protein
MQLGTYEDVRAARRLLGDDAFRAALTFNPLVAQKALAYFEGGDLTTLDQGTRPRLVEEARQDLDIPTLPLASTRLD